MDAIVALAPAGAERHCVGRAPGQRALPQAEVNALLVELGRATATSCGSRAATRSSPRAAARRRVALREAGIAVRRRPRRLGRAGRARRGGHPADAAPALASRATFVDGNDDPEHAEPPDWDALARLGGTLVILTGRGRIRRIAAKLIDGGRAPDTPIAAISAASRAGAAGPARHARRAARAAAAARDLRRRRRRRARPHRARSSGGRRAHP